MSKTKDAIFVESRRQKISDLIQKQGSVSVSKLCEQFCVSSATVRTDLSFLENQGILKRTHGGAIRAQDISYEMTTQEKMAQNTLEKDAIAEAALTFVQSGDVIAIDTGTTGLAFAKHLVSFSELTVVTNDIQIASYLEQNTDFYVWMLGGVIRKNFHYTVGSSIFDTLNNLHIDTFFLSTNGISLARGLSTHNGEIADIKHKLMEVSSKVVLLADKTKFERNAFVVYSPIDALDAIVTNADLKDSIQKIPEYRHIEYVRVNI